MTELTDIIVGLYYLEKLKEEKKLNYTAYSKLKGKVEEELKEKYGIDLKTKIPFFEEEEEEEEEDEEEEEEEEDFEWEEED